MRKKFRISSGEEDDLTLSKTPPKNKKFKIMDQDISDGLSEDYYSSPKRSNRNYSRHWESQTRRSSRLNHHNSPKKVKYALRSVVNDQEMDSPTRSIGSIHQEEVKDDNYGMENENLEKEEFSEDFESLSENENYSKRPKAQKRETRQTSASYGNHLNSEIGVQEEESIHDESEIDSDDDEDDGWKEEEEEEEEDLYDLTDNIRMTRSRKAYYRSDKDNDSRSLRKKQPVNYASQMYPQAFKDVDALVELDKSNNLPLGLGKNPLNRNWGMNMRTPSKLFRLNEDDDEQNTAPPKGRFFALLKGGATGRGNSAQPLNLTQLLKSQQTSLLKNVDEETRISFEARQKRLMPQTMTEEDIDFTKVAGLDERRIFWVLILDIASLKEMVVIPLLYPELFSNFQITPPRGVLFHGPPGTGKTLMARALAASCSTSSRPVAFFVRKGADVLNKWVGESEKQLRQLFEQAKAWQPSIIFFDEIDGLAPVRSSKQDQIHSSIVSTLLALMDGLDNRGQVIVIGATNRIDSIDPALRRPGRFDREFFFPLPSEVARKKIIDLATEKWTPKLDESFKSELSLMTRGYNGADVKAMCTEAALCAIRRSIPQIYTSKEKLVIDPTNVHVGQSDFVAAMNKIVPSTERSGTLYGRPLPPHLDCILEPFSSQIQLFFNQALSLINQRKKNSFLVADKNAGLIFDCLRSYEPHLLISGLPDMGQKYLGPFAIDILEKAGLYVKVIDIASLLSQSDITPEAHLFRLFHELKRQRCSALFIYEINQIWDVLSESAIQTLKGLLFCDRQDPIILTGTTSVQFEELNEDIQVLFGRRESVSWKKIVALEKPSDKSRNEFFRKILNDIPYSFSRMERKVDVIEAPSLPKAEEVASVDDMFKDQATEISQERDRHKLAVRQYFGMIVEDLKKNFKVFARPVDREQNPGYNPEKPMDLGTMEEKIFNNQYLTADDLMEDFSLIVRNVQMYNDPSIPYQKDNILKALRLRDCAQEHLLLLPRDFIQACWLFRLLDKSAPTNQDNLEGNVVTELPPTENLMENPVLEGDEEDNNAKSQNSLDEENDDGMEMENVPLIAIVTQESHDGADPEDQVTHVPKSPNLELENEQEMEEEEVDLIDDEQEMEQVNDQQMEEHAEMHQVHDQEEEQHQHQEEAVISDETQVPVVTPLAEEAVDGIIHTLVDLTRDMNLSQVEDVGVALSALAISSHQESIHQVINVRFVRLI